MNNRSILSTTSSTTSTSRLTEFLQNTPVVTIALLLLNLAIHLFFFLTSYNVGYFTFNASRIIYQYEYYRIFSSAFIHGGLLHIAMNMMSLLALGVVIESNYGSLKFFLLTWWCVILSSFCAISLSWITALATNDWSYIYINSVGYSGVLFSYALIDSYHTNEPWRSVMGLFTVPTKYYPFILLVILQIMLPNISFFGHLGGLLAGIIMISSLSSFLFMPSQGGIEWLEANAVLSSIKRFPSYKLVTNRDLVHPHFEIRDSQQGLGLVASYLYHFMSIVLSYIMQLLYTIGYIIGLPVDRISETTRQCFNSIKLCFVKSWESIISIPNMIHKIFVGVQGYESLPQSSSEADLAVNSVNEDVRASIDIPGVEMESLPKNLRKV